MLAVDVLLALALLFTAAWAFLRFQPIPIGAYFLAQLCAIPLMWVAKWVVGDQSSTYLWVYILTVTPILIAILGIAWVNMTSRAHRSKLCGIAALIAFIPAALAKTGLEHPTLAQWFILLEATVLVWAGIIVGVMAAYIRLEQVAIAFAALWMMQALFFYAALLHWPKLQAASWIVLPVMALVAWTFIGKQFNSVKAPAGEIR